MPSESPVNPLPPVVLALAGVLAAIEIIFALAETGLIGGREGIGWRIAAFERYGFVPGIWDLVVQRGETGLGYVQRFVTYAFIQPDIIGALFGGAMVLALGKFVGEVFHWGAVLLVFFASIILGAVAFGILAPGNPLLIGVFPAVYGLIGAFTYLTWLRLGSLGENQLMAFRLIGFLMGLQLVFGLLFGSSWQWIADLAGFAVGLGLSPLIAPGGWQAFVRRMRAR